MKRKPTDLIFKISHQFNLYLQRVKLDVSKMSAVQYNETKRAFYAGWAQYFYLTTTEWDGLPVEECMEIMDCFEKELREFWDEQVKDQKEGKINYPAQMLVYCDCGWSGPVYQLKQPTSKENNICRCPGCGSDRLNVRK